MLQPGLRMKRVGGATFVKAEPAQPPAFPFHAIGEKERREPMSQE